MFLMITIGDGQESAFKRSLFEEIMARNAVEPAFPLYGVDYPDGSGCTEILGCEDAAIECLGFSRFGPGMFFDRLWELADRTECYFAWPDETRFVAVTSEELRAKLPADLCDEFEPYVVKNGHELYWAISGVDPKDAPPIGSDNR